MRLLSLVVAVFAAACIVAGEECVDIETAEVCSAVNFCTEDPYADVVCKKTCGICSTSTNNGGGGLPSEASLSTNYDASHHRHSSSGNSKRNAAHYAHKYKRHARKFVPRQKRQTACDSSYPYRSSDGTCNNVNNPEWGSVGQQFQRLLDPVYEGVNKDMPRMKSADNSTYLKSPRDISVEIHDFDRQRLADQSTVMLMEWGQFLAHDVVGTPVSDVDGDCCTDDLATSGYVYEEGPCFPIIVSEGDLTFTEIEDRCMEFVRSYNGNTDGRREQVNLLSAYIDGSNVYGTTEDETLALRTNSGTGAKLAVYSGTDNLPEDESGTNYCIAGDDYCMLAGDSRVNVYPGLGALHTIFARYHNYLVDELAAKYPSYDDETLFQEARKLNVAVLQSITYQEYLPAIIGKTTITTHGIDAAYAYDDTCDATLYNVFATAAFRFGHSMVPDTLLINGVEYESIDLFNRPSFVLHNLDSLIEGLVSRNAEKADRWYSQGMTNHLFEEPDKGYKGKDVASLNIQRGRDHGLPAYNEWRDHCGLDKLTFGTIEFNRRFERVYTDINDVDLYSGALAERSVNGAMIGDTYACLLGKQFANLRSCDRFFYENTDQFNSDQIRNLNRVRLSDVICQTTSIPNIQDRAFRAVDGQNPTLACSEILTRSLDIDRFF